jgi:hypothetical protein
MEPQDQNTPTSSQTPESVQYSSPLPAEHRGSMGAVIGAIIIVVILLLIGLYLWGAQLAQSPSTVTEEVVEETSDEAPLTGTDAVADIESDLEATEFEEIDDELNSIEAELEAELQ